MAERYSVERHDQDDGSITWEIWDTNVEHYRRLCSINDRDTRHALADARLIAKALNDSGATP